MIKVNVYALTGVNSPEVKEGKFTYVIPMSFRRAGSLCENNTARDIKGKISTIIAYLGTF